MRIIQPPIGQILMPGHDLGRVRFLDKKPGAPDHEVRPQGRRRSGHKRVMADQSVKGRQQPVRIAAEQFQLFGIPGQFCFGSFKVGAQDQCFGWRQNVNGADKSVPFIRLGHIRRLRDHLCE